MDWTVNAQDWPMAAASRFILSKPHKWHVQIAGDGPLILLIHGAGGATQSWRHLFPILAQNYRVIALDLPGQGFTKLGAQQRCGLAEMAHDVAQLCKAENWTPSAIVGHSAGAAIALQMAADIDGTPPRIIGINAALDTFKGVAGFLFPVMAKTLAMLPLVADMFVASASRGQAVQKLIDGTGSKLPALEIIFYKRLIRDRQHVNATLQMMAQWDLDPLIKGLGKIKAPSLLMAGDADQMVPWTVSQTAAGALIDARFCKLEGLGHLAHEEDPQRVADIITEFLSGKKFTAVN